MRPTRILACLPLLLAAPAWATVQLREKLEFEGRVLEFYAAPGAYPSPLEPYFAWSGTQRPTFMHKPGQLSTNIWRGYVGTWRIEHGILYLVDIDGYVDGNRVELARFFKDMYTHHPAYCAAGKIRAVWYTGPLSVAEPGASPKVFHVEAGRISRTE